MAISWSNLSTTDKLALVMQLSSIRKELAAKSRLKRAGIKKTKNTKLTFKSKELEDLFNSMPSGIQKSIFGR